jgi:hypothetical protein
MHRGYVTVHRKILDNPVVFKDADHIAVWIYLMLNATHKNFQALFKGQSITLLPGQLITGRLSIAKKLKINDSKVKRILNLFKNEQLIDQQATNQNSLITLVSWGKYQKSDQQSDQRVTNEWTTGDQRVTTNKNVNNVQEQKKVQELNISSDEEKTKKKLNAWAIWVDINRARNRADPIPTGADTKAAKMLISHIKDLQTIKDVMGLFLDDDDQYLQRNGHALRLISGRVNAYINQAENLFSVPADDEALAAIMKIEDEVAAEEQAKHEKKSGNTERPASSN